MIIKNVYLLVINSPSLANAKHKKYKLRSINDKFTDKKNDYKGPLL